MHPPTHGGDLAGYRETYGRMPLDFSANTSPLGVPESVRNAAAAALLHADRYPDPYCRALCRAIAKKAGCRPENVLCGSGAADLFFRAALALKPKTALLLAPTFSEYEAALSLAETALSFYPLKPETGFLPQEDLLDRITPGLSLLVLCEPNNPTGRTTPAPLLQKIEARCRETGTFLWCDECFGGFLEKPHTLLPRVPENPRLLLFTAFTKLYGMAGLRLGVCFGAERVLSAMRAAGQPWSVSTPAQAAGLAALRDEAYAESVRACVRAERPFLFEGLIRLGFSVVPGEANYLLFSTDLPDLGRRCAEKGILLRSCANYRGLSDAYYRTAVRTHAENERLLAVLREIQKEAR